MTIDIADDLSRFDNTETVTVVLKRTAGPTSLSVDDALRRVLDARQRLLLGTALTGHEIVWNLPAESLSGAQLEPGDTISTGPTDSWTVRTAELVALGTRWRAVCRRQRAG